MSEIKTEGPHRCTEENAPSMANWIKNRHGLALWKSINLNNPNQIWTTPARKEDGSPTDKPHWSVESSPYRIITDPREVIVDVPKEVKRFRVAVTNASSNRVEKALKEFGNNSWYRFDYGTQECVIFVPEYSITLDEWMEKNPQ